MGPLLLKSAGIAGTILAGYVLKRAGVLRGEDAQVLSRIILNLTLPAALITSFQSFRWDTSFLSLIALAVACNLLLLALSLRLTRGKPLPVRALYALNLPSYNIGTFVLPFAQSFLPAQALIGVSMFDAGNCPINSGVSYAVVSALGSGQRVHLGFVADKLRRSVPFIVYLAMMLMGICSLRLPEPVYQITGWVGAANSPLAMLMIGLLFEARVEREDRRQVAWILLLRYGCNLVLAALVWLLPLSLLIRQVAVLSLLAPIPSIAMVYCEACGCKPSLYGVLNSLCIAISLCLTFVLLVLWQI